MNISIIIKKYIVQKCKDCTKSKETKNSTICFGSNPLYLVQTSHNLNACNVDLSCSLNRQCRRHTCILYYMQSFAIYMQSHTSACAVKIYLMFNS